MIIHLTLRRWALGVRDVVVGLVKPITFPVILF